jgi:outer membrane protein OmpA-like peptidoglycan-associated protein
MSAKGSNKKAAMEDMDQSLRLSTSAKLKRLELQRRLERLEESRLASTAYTNDPDFPVWVVSDSDFYFCYGWEWEDRGRRLKGIWMKQSEARKAHKESLTGLPCGLYSRVQTEQARADAARAVQADEQNMKAEAEKSRYEAELARQEADTARASAEQQTQALAVEADKARKAAEESDRLRQEAEKEKADLRAQLLQQLNTILATRDTARGLIANMSDVLFKTGSFELLPGSRERLAKVSGIIIAHPGLHLEVVGYTDSMGGHEYNQKLSENRARAVRDYLVQQGVPDSAIVSRGLGKAEPVASNDNPDGRQQNRRVELVISGEAIGPKTAGTGTPAPK